MFKNRSSHRGGKGEISKNQKENEKKGMLIKFNVICDVTLFICHPDFVGAVYFF